MRKCNLFGLGITVTALAAITTSTHAAILTAGPLQDDPSPGGDSNLTTVGIVDWAVWNNTNNTAANSFSPTNTKLNGPASISAISPVTTDTVRGVSSLTETYTYSDGTAPPSLAAGSTQGGIISSTLTTVGNGVKLTVAGNTNTTYYVYVWGVGSNGTGTMTASLNGASPVSVVSATYGGSTRPADLFLFSFKPDSASDLLNIQYVLSNSTGSNSFSGIQAVAVSTVPEPATASIFGLAATGLLIRRRRVG